MNRVIGAALLAAIVVMPVSASAGEQTVRLSVPGMTCASCPYIIESSISALEGVKDVKANFEDRTATVTYDDEAMTVEAITRATGEVGFESIVIEADKKP